MRRKYGKLYYDKKYWAQTDNIIYLLDGKVEKWTNYLKVLDGNWDITNRYFEDIKIYRAFKQRYEEGEKWEDIDYYKVGLKHHSNKLKETTKKGREVWDRILLEQDLLFYQIKENGMIFQRDLPKNKGLLVRFNKPAILDDIAIDINREGRLLLEDGKHRLAIAKILGLTKVPIIIIRRHKKWMVFRKNLISFVKNYKDVLLYQFLNHPDLKKIPFQKEESIFNIIRENISYSNNKILVIGANLGYFCHKFEDEGFDCYGLEENRICNYFLKNLKRIEEKKFHIISESLFEYKNNQELNFDVVIALNTFHHYLEKKEDYMNLIDFLKRLKTNIMFFCPHSPKEFRNKKLFQNFDPEQFVLFILEHTSLKTATRILKLKSGRIKEYINLLLILISNLYFLDIRKSVFF